MKSTAAQERYKNDFDKKFRFRPVIAVGDFVYVDRSPRPLTAVEHRARRQDSTDTVDLAVKLLPKTEGPFRVRAVTDSTVFIDQDEVSNRVSTDRVTKMPRGPRDTVTPAPNTDTEQEAEAPRTEYVLDRLVGHRESPSGIQYLVRWYGYSPTDDTYEPADGLPQAFIDRYWKSRATARAKARRA